MTLEKVVDSCPVGHPLFGSENVALGESTGPFSCHLDTTEGVNHTNGEPETKENSLVYRTLRL